MALTLLYGSVILARMTSISICIVLSAAASRARGGQSGKRGHLRGENERGEPADWQLEYEFGSTGKPG